MVGVVAGVRGTGGDPVTAQIVRFPTPDYLDPVKGLRNLADKIEAGERGEVTSVGIVLFNGELEVFGMGSDSAGPVVALLFNAAALRFAREVADA